MRVLVTGASGFVGSHVVDELCARGHAARVLLRATSDTSQLPPDVERVTGSLEEPESLAAAVAGVDAVVHAAGLVKASSDEEFRRVNVEGTRLLLAAVQARAPSIRRFVQISSIAAGGPTHEPRPRDPAAPDRPVTRYGRSKLEGERVALAAAPELPVSVVRPPVLYGPRDRESLPLYRLARLGLRFVVHGGVTHTSMLHARDCAAAIADLLEREHPRGRVYTVDDGAAHPVAEVMRSISRAVGRRTIGLPVPLSLLRPVAAVGSTLARWSGRSLLVDRDKLAEFEGPCWVVGHEAITADVGWRPTTELSLGLAETARWYRDHGWL